MKLYATMGPSCHEAGLFAQMLEGGIDGIRLNLSHGNIQSRLDWLENWNRACEMTGKNGELLLDLQGREVRILNDAPLSITAGQPVDIRFVPAAHADQVSQKDSASEKDGLDNCLLLPDFLQEVLRPGSVLNLDDHKIELEIVSESQGVCQKDCLLLPRKSVAVNGQPLQGDIISFSDLQNLKDGRAYHLSGILVPFVQSPADLDDLRQVLAKHGLSDLTLFAKIENRQGMDHLESIAKAADENTVLVFARGDLGNALGIEALPLLQMRFEQICHKNNARYLIVTGLLASMTDSSQCSRSEACDVFFSALRGADCLMLTNETAASNYPLQAAQTLASLASAAASAREQENGQVSSQQKNR